MNLAALTGHLVAPNADSCVTTHASCLEKLAPLVILGYIAVGVCVIIGGYLTVISFVSPGDDAPVGFRARLRGILTNAAYFILAPFAAAIVACAIAMKMFCSTNVKESFDCSISAFHYVYCSLPLEREPGWLRWTIKPVRWTLEGVGYCDGPMRGPIGGPECPGGVCPAPKCDPLIAAVSSATKEERHSLDDLLVDADDTRRVLSGFGLGDDALKTPTLAAYALESPTQNLGLFRFQAAGMTDREATRVRSRALWSLALGMMAETLADRIEVPFRTDLEQAQSVLDLASTAADLLKSPEVRAADPLLADVGRAARDLFYTSKYARVDHAMDRVSAIFGGLSILTAATQTYAERADVGALVHRAQFAAALALIDEAVRKHASDQSVLSEVAADAGKIGSALLAEADKDYAIGMLRTAIDGLVVIQGTAIAGALVTGGSSLAIAVVAFVVGIAADAVMAYALEPGEYLQAYQGASLLYTLAEELADGGDEPITLAVRSAAIDTANKLMDDHVVGKLVPHVVRSEEWPIVGDMLQDLGLAIEVPPEAEAAWRDYLAAFYGKSSTLGILESRSNPDGRLAKPLGDLVKLPECLWEP